MKRLCCAAMLAAIILIAACKKDNTSAAIGHWSFGGADYNAASAIFSKDDSTLTAANDDGKLTVFFPSDKVQAGSYLIVNYDSVPLRERQIYIRFIQTSGSQYFFSTGTDAVSADVRVFASGKVSAVIPLVYLESYNNPVPHTAQSSGTINGQ